MEDWNGNRHGKLEWKQTWKIVIWNRTWMDLIRKMDKNIGKENKINKTSETKQKGGTHKFT